MGILRKREERSGEDKKKGRKKERRTAGQQKPPQQDSPATQNVSPQQVDPMGMQKGARSEEAGMQHWTFFFFIVSEFTLRHIHTVHILRMEILTVRIEALAAHVPRAKIIRTAGKDPCFADGDVVVERCSQGREDGRVGRESLGGEGYRGGGVGCEGWGCEVACGCIDAVGSTD